MNYIEQIKWFWQLDKTWQFSCCETRLYFYLLETANCLGWENKFWHRDATVIGNVGVSGNTMKTARNKLTQAGLIIVEQGGKGYGDKTRYQILKPKSYPKVHPNHYPKVHPNHEPLTKQNETKRKSKSHLPPNGDNPEKKVTEHWEEIVECWFVFYKQKFDAEPTFNGQSTKALKTITETIQKAWIKSGKEWTAENAKICLENFFSKAYKDEWLKQNFLLTNLASKFDSIIQKKTEDGKTNCGSTSENGYNKFQP